MITQPGETPVSRRPRVCIIQYNSSKYLTRVDRAARTLAEAGWDVVLVAIKDQDTAAFEDRGAYVVHRVELRARSLPSWPLVRVLRHIEAVFRTFSLAVRLRADVYDARDAEPLLVAWAAARIRRARLVYDSDELNLDRNKPQCRKRWWRFAMFRFERFFTRRADVVLTTDHGRADVLQERYRIPRPTVILNVPESFPEIEADLAFRARALGDRDFLLIYQGVLIENRGIPEMIRAMSSLTDCSLAVVGYGHRGEEYRRLAADLDLRDAVRFFDAVPFEQLMRYTAAADVGMIPLIPACLSYVYAAPNKLFEYMMAGIPVVATDLPDMAAIVEQERVGTLIADASDPAGIVDAVRRLLDGDESLTVVGRRARDAALHRYNWGIESARLLAAYANLGPHMHTDPVSAGYSS